MYEKLLSLDRDLFTQLNFDGGVFMDTLMIGVTSKLFLAAALVGTLAYLYINRKLKPLDVLYLALGVGLVILFADQTCNFFKSNTPRLRPMHEPLLEGMVYLVDNMRGGQYGTVSAHAANSVGTLFFLGLVVRRCWFVYFAVVAALLVEYSRIYLGYHYPLDLFYGTIAGFIYGYAVYRIYLAVMKKIGRNNHL